MMHILLMPMNWRLVNRRARGLRPWMLVALLSTIIGILPWQPVTADLIDTPVLIDVYDDAAPHFLVEENVPLELYVKRVLPNEWNPGWEEEALKAGAVAARTWVLSSENWKDIDGDGVKETYAVDEKVKGVQLGPLGDPSDRFRNVTEWYIVTRRVIIGRLARVHENEQSPFDKMAR